VYYVSKIQYVLPNITFMKIKYAIFTFLMLGMMTTVFAQTQKYQYPDANGPQGISVVSRSATQMVLNFSVEEFSVSPIDIKGEEMMTLQFDNTLLPNDEGKPNLPGVSHYFALPQGAVAHVSILSKREEVISNIEIAPAPRIPLDTEDGPMEYNKDVKVYNKNAFYPAETVAVSEPTVIRGVDASIVGITPFRYNPVTKELVVIRDMEIEVTFEGGNGVFGDLKYRNRFWDPILNDMLLNADMLPEVDYSKRTYGAKDETGCEYVIITPTGADFLAWADSIKNFRNRQGILTQVFTLEEVGGNTTSAIENFINDAYNNWDIPPAATLLLGDYGSDITNSVVSPIWDSYCVSDNIYAGRPNAGSRSVLKLWEDTSRMFMVKILYVLMQFMAVILTVTPGRQPQILRRCFQSLAPTDLDTSLLHPVNLVVGVVVLPLWLPMPLMMEPLSFSIATMVVKMAGVNLIMIMVTSRT